MSELTSAVEIRQKAAKSQLGFWIYLLTDGILFASLFATYMILRHNVNGGVGSHDIFDLYFVLIETLILLTSSYTIGLANVALKGGRKNEFLVYFSCTIALGLLFLGMEVNEFISLAADGHTWATSAFLSSFFTLVGTHGAHITVGLLWGSVLALAFWKRGFSDPHLRRKFSLFAVFWHFLDVIWIFIFTIVYVMGVI